MPTRRQVLGAFAAPAALATLDPARALAVAAELARHAGAPEEVAGDEDFWFEVQRAFTCDRSLVNFNNGGVSPSPSLVQAAMKRHLDYSNLAPAYTMWRVLEPQREVVRERLARHWGVDPEEVALVRNASEGLQTCQLGVDLARGDEVLTSTQDYPRMLTTFRQRERREGIVLRQVTLPGPEEDDAEVVRRFAAAITDRTRLMLVCHMINLTGRVLPVRALVELGRDRGIPVVVDGAHALAHVPFRLPDLGCDYYATSLHKWLFAPHGTGLLYVRRERIGDLWPLMAAPEAQDDDVRKFEEIGTHPAANYLAVGEALTFHQGLGDERKAARLVYLRDRWAHRLLEHDRVRLHTSLAPGRAVGIASVAVDGVHQNDLASWLWKERRILVSAIGHEECAGLRVSPSVYSTLEEVDRFGDAIEHVLRHGLPT